METNPYATPDSQLINDEGISNNEVELWNPNVAGLWSVLLSPVFGQVLVYKNWQEIGDEKQIKEAKNMLYATIAMLFAPLIIPIKTLGLIWLVVWYYTSQKKQAVYVKENWGKDYQKRKWGVPLLIGVTGFIAYLALIFVILISLEAMGFNIT